MISTRTVGFVTLISLAIVVPFCFFNSPGTSDVLVDLNWIANWNNHGPRVGYIANQDSYPPMIPILLYLAAGIAKLFQISAFAAFKTSLVLFLFLTSLITFLWTKNAPFAAMLHFALMLNSVNLGYLDIFMAPTLIASLWALHRQKFAVFAILFTLSCLTKFQPLILAPFIFVYLASRDRATKVLGSVVLSGVMVLSVFFSIFGTEISMALWRALFEHPQLSANALNLNWVVTYFLHLFAPQTYGPLVNGRVDLIMAEESNLLWFMRLMFLSIYILILIGFSRRTKSFKNFLSFSLVGYLSYFTLNAGVHENHLFLAAILGLILYWIDRKYAAVVSGLVLLANLNLVMFYGINGRGLTLDRVVGIDLTVPLSVITVALFGRLSILAFKTSDVTPAVIVNTSPPVGLERSQFPAHRS